MWAVNALFEDEEKKKFIALLLWSGLVGAAISIFSGNCQKYSALMSQQILIFTQCRGKK